MTGTHSAPSARKNLVDNVFKFDDDHPQEFQKLKSLLNNRAIKFDEEELRYELGDIVYSFGRRYRDLDYAANIALLEQQAAAAASALSEAHRAVQSIDGNHLELFNNLIAELLPELAQDMQFPQLINEIELMSLKAHVIAFAVRAVTSTETKPRGRSRPTLPYQMPTFQLIDLWEALTGEPVATPKGTAKGTDGRPDEAAQPSTEFVRLALKMIDPKITAANAVTSIKKALSAGKKATYF
jgi:hypothetical protein